MEPVWLAAILKRLKELMRNPLKPDLKEFVSKLKNEQIEALVPKCFTISDGTNILHGILASFDGSPLGQAKIYKIIELCMKQTGCAPSQIIQMYISKCSSDQLVKLVDLSIELIRRGNDGTTAWKDTLPECLLNLANRQGTVTHCGTEMPFSEFKSKTLISICHLTWPDDITTQITTMFVDIELNKDEHAMVVNKICTHISSCRADSLPPLFHQLLRLCKNRNIHIPLCRADDYFKCRLYSKLKLREGLLPDSESTNYDIEEIESTSIEELQQTLSMCLYHISQGCTSHEMKRTLLKEWNKSKTLTSPFLCNVLLAVANKSIDAHPCLAILKSCLQQQCSFRRSYVRSAWWRALGLEIVDTKLLLTTLIDETKVHGHLTSYALLDLGFLLLSVGNRDAASEAIWAHGQTIIVKLCRRQPGSLPTILSTLGDKLVSDGLTNPGKQYTDLLSLLSRHVPVTMIDKSSAVQSLLERCLLSGRDWSMACNVTEAVQPIARINTRIRDTILMLCRKGMFASEKETRRVAVAGLLGLLNRLDASQKANVTTGSIHTMNSDSHSLLTQISIDLHATQVGDGIKSRINDSAISVEIVSILKRCLIQSDVVKQDFYNGLCRAVINKPFLQEYILDFLLEHLSKYLTPEQQESPFCPLMIEKCVEIKDIDIVLVEPLSHLIFAIQQLFLYSVTEGEDAETVDTVLESGGSNLRAAALLIRISDAMASCHVEEYGLDNSFSLQDLIPESKAKVAVIKQILQSLEALIAYRVNEWSLDHVDQGTKILNLFKAYQEIADFTKSSSKTKKGAKTSPKPKGKGKKNKEALKIKTMVKDRAGPFRVPPCLWDVRTALRILTLLQSDAVPWARTDSTASLRVKREFQRFSAKGVHSALTTVKNDRHPSKSDLNFVGEITWLIYVKCIEGFVTICSYDQQTCLHLLECFEECLHICLSTNSTFCSETFAKIVSFSADSGISRSSDAILTSLTKCLDRTKDNDVSAIDEEEPSAKKIILILMRCITLMVDKAPNHFFVKGCHIIGDEENYGEEALIYLENFFRESAGAPESMLVPLLMLTSRRRQDWSLVDAVAAQVRKILGLIDAEQENPEVSTVADDVFPSLTEKTAPLFITSLSSHLCLRCESAQRALVSIGEMNHSDKGHKEACRTLFVELCRLSASLALCCMPQSPIGRATDSVLKLASDHYALLSSVIKHFTMRVTLVGREAGNYLLQYCRFEKLLKMSGKKLSNCVDSFISHVMATDVDGSHSKAIKDTRTIPKLVFGMETFNKNLIVLEKKCKQNFQRYISIGTARDFRIQALVLKEVLNTAKDTTDENIQDVTECGDAEPDRAVEEAASDAESTNAVEEEDDDNDDDEQVVSEEDEDVHPSKSAKKLRLSLKCK